MSTPPAAPDYNAKRKSDFKIAKIFKEMDGSYSSFWPLLLVFCSLVAMFTYDVDLLRHRKLVLAQQLTQLMNQEKVFKEQADFVEGMHKDMQAMAPDHPAVAKILHQYFPEDAATPAAESK